MHAIYLLLNLYFNSNIKLNLNFIVIILKYCILLFNIYTCYTFIYDIYKYINDTQTTYDII